MTRVKSILLDTLIAINIIDIVMMLIVGYADHINPIKYPTWCNIGLLFPVFLVINIVFLILWLAINYKIAWIPIVALIICYEPIRTYTPFNLSQKANGRTLKIMSYNVYAFGGWGNPDEKTKKMVDYILKQDADIICLQESWTSIEKLKYIDSLVKDKYKYRRNIRKYKSDDALAIFSKYKILNEKHILYDNEEYNFSTAYLLDINGDSTIIINNHFRGTNLTNEDRANFKEMVRGDISTSKTKHNAKKIINTLNFSTIQRVPQVNKVKSFVKHHKKYNIILCGDFNDSPISYTHRTLAYCLTDCYIEAGNGPGISYHQNSFYVRIDNIMCTKGWKPINCTIDNTIKQSDHYPIIAILQKNINSIK